MDAEWIRIEEAAAILGIGRMPANRLAQVGAVIARKAEKPHGNGHYPWEFNRASVEARAARMKQTPEEPDYLNEWMPIAEAMKALRLTRHAVKRRMHMGLLNSTHFGPPEKQALYVSRPQVEEQVAQRPRFPRQKGWGELPSDENERAWAAGFFDGEGCVCISFKGRSHWVMLTLPNSSQRAILRLHAALGGQVYPRPRQKPHYRDQWVWHASGDEAYAILVAIRQNLSAKDEQADLAIEFQEHVRRHRHSRWDEVPSEEIEWREEQRLKVSRLNRPNIDRP